VQLPVDDMAFSLKVTFPDSNKHHHTLAKLPELVLFQASKPMSFSTLVALVQLQRAGVDSSASQHVRQ
jgi:hypothetical protein